MQKKTRNDTSIQVLAGLYLCYPKSRQLGIDWRHVWESV